MNQLSRPFARVQERDYSAHHALIRIAKLELETAESKGPGWFNSAFIATTFSALAIEALCNAIGDRAVTDWKDFESASPSAKVRLLAEHLEIPFNRKEQPWSTLLWLGKFRNQIAHAKPERLVVERRLTEAEAAIRANEPPESSIERQVTIGQAKRCVGAIEALKLKLCERLPDEDRFSLFADGWSTSTHRHHEA